MYLTAAECSGRNVPTLCVCVAVENLPQLCLSEAASSGDKCMNFILVSLSTAKMLPAHPKHTYIYNDRISI